MNTLNIDIETYSSADLGAVGVYKYVESPDFEVLLFAYSIDGGPVELIDLTFEELPDEVFAALTDPKVIKKAFNAAFERTCLAKHTGLKMPPEQWECTMVRAGMAGLPMSLDIVARVLNLTEQKDSAGKTLIKYFSVPCKPTKANGQRSRNLPCHDVEKWQQFGSYCVQDVVTEMAVGAALDQYPKYQHEKRLWDLDQCINDKGILIDQRFVRNAIAISNQHTEELTAVAQTLTGLDNPNSVAQLKGWVAEASGVEIDSLTKGTVTELLATDLSADVAEALRIRQELSKTSVTKYEKMIEAVCADGSVKGLLQYYGANRTGRWAGRLVQVQNLPQNHLKDLDLAREVVKAGDIDTLRLLYGNVPDTLSQLIRTAFIAPEGYLFASADYSAIEARVIAWLAGEKWRLDVFNTHGKIYEASASQMFRVPIESITKGSDLRQRGKVSELALGYQGGPNALISMGALKMGIAEEELPKLVKMWRNANKAIVQLWDDVQTAAIAALTDGPQQIQHNIQFFMRGGALYIQLPSGRHLIYQGAKLAPNRFGDESIQYYGMNQMTKRWERQETYGGKLVENIVQAIARDIMGDAMLRINYNGYEIKMTVHDEIVTLVRADAAPESLEDIVDIMTQSIAWAKGLPLRADGFLTPYYKKDD